MLTCGMIVGSFQGEYKLFIAHFLMLLDNVRKEKNIKYFGLFKLK